ncbi:amino acid ABC transporter permease [Kocuria gwangalliensis]|uniref:Amino acid ABC transporter permease n=1 Tax=Kocuria gwangalliensis TaxID=501592 RepID=A0ABP8XJR3_9MICC
MTSSSTAAPAGAEQSDRPPAEPARRPDALTVVPARNPWRWVGTALVAVVLVGIGWSLFTNPRWQWDVVAEWLTAESVINALGNTLLLTAIAAVGGFVLGFFLALMRMSSSGLLSSVAWFYIWIFRSVPLLVQLLLWYNVGYLYEVISVGIPGTDVMFFQAPTTDIVNKFGAAVLGLTLHQAAYSAEIIRGGILAVDQGQQEAAASLGIPRWRRSTHIVLPQALRSILPPAFNEIISLVKGTSVVYVLAYNELFYTIQVIYARTNEVIPMLLVATLWYVIITTVLNIIQYYVERHFARGAVRTLPPTPLQRLRSRIGGAR